ncbi:MAG: CHAT domain-containing protein [Pyrinomonadaceae bacterium]
MKYLNLNLEAFEYRKENTTERFRVRVTNSPAGEQRSGDAETVSLQDDLRSRLRRLERRGLTLQQMIALGEDLGSALFPPRVRDLYIRSLASLEETEGLRIRLMIDAYALSDIPWEYVYLSDADTPANQKRANGFLVFNPQISLVRYQMIGRALGKIEAVGEESLRMVALLSNPGNTPDLDLAREEQNIREALKELPQIQAEFHPNVTIEKLLKILIKPAHIFHFSGHGSFQGSMGDTFGSEEGEGTLALTGEDGQAVDFPAEKLAMNLAGRGVRFAMLGACESSKVDQINAWTGIAPALTQAGIPAVVGMQFKVLDLSAIAFSNILYDSLAAGLTIDEAVTKGRLAIYTLGDDDERDWGVPVLYLRAEEGVLFPKPKPNLLLPTEKPVSPKPVPTTVNLRTLREAIVKSFSLEDLEILCADLQTALAEAGIDLQVNLDLIEGNGKTAKVQSLIGYLDRRGYLAYLLEAVREARPNIGV